jgi:hypothetical protein
MELWGLRAIPVDVAPRGRNVDVRFGPLGAAGDTTVIPSGPGLRQKRPDRAGTSRLPPISVRPWVCAPLRSCAGVSPRSGGGGRCPSPWLRPRSSHRARRCWQLEVLALAVAFTASYAAAVPSGSERKFPIRLTARGKVVGSYRIPSSEFYAAPHGKQWGVHAPSGALETLHGSEAEAWAEAWRLTVEWKRR